MYALALLVAIVLSRAVPMEPPTCCEVLTVAEVTPESRAATPAVAVEKTGMNVSPMPRPISSSGARISVVYEECTVIRVRITMAIADRSMPGTMRARGGTWCSSRAEICVEPTMIATVSGRKARPARTGE